MSPWEYGNIRDIGNQHVNKVYIDRISFANEYQMTPFSVYIVLFPDRTQNRPYQIMCKHSYVFWLLQKFFLNNAVARNYYPFQYENDNKFMIKRHSAYDIWRSDKFMDWNNVIVTYFWCPRKIRVKKEVETWKKVLVHAILCWWYKKCCMIQNGLQQKCT